MIKDSPTPSISSEFYSRTDKEGGGFSNMVSEAGGLEFEPQNHTFRRV
jgi:hypothetical protein